MVQLNFMEGNTMIFIYGGVYQGKLDYVKREYNVKDEEIYTCKGQMDWESPEDALELLSLAKTIHRLEKGGKTVKVINHLENFTFAIAEQLQEVGQTQIQSSVDYFEKNLDIFRDKIIIMEDVSMGIVPIDKVQRIWREENGRLASKIAQNSEQVIRVFCGLAQRLK